MHGSLKLNSPASGQALDTPPARPMIRPSRAQAEMAVRTLIRWAGDNPDREGLTDTPNRVVRAFEQWFAGYAANPAQLLRRTFNEAAGYDEMVVLRNIGFVSHCEHHMAPIHGRAHIGYLPRDRVVGISKVARVVDAFSKRLQIQERMTAEIASTLETELQPQGGRSRRQRGPRLHDQQGRPAIPSHDGHDPHAGALSRAAADPASVPVRDQSPERRPVWEPLALMLHPIG